MNETNYEALRSAFETIVAHIKGIDTRVSTVLEQVPETIKDIAVRMHELELRFDQLTIAAESTIEDTVARVMQENSIIDNKVEAALEDYEPDEHMDMEGSVRNVLDGAYWFEDAVKDAVRELNFTVEVR